MELVSSPATIMEIEDYSLATAAVVSGGQSSPGSDRPKSWRPKAAQWNPFSRTLTEKNRGPQRHRSSVGPESFIHSRGRCQQTGPVTSNTGPAYPEHRNIGLQGLLLLGEVAPSWKTPQFGPGPTMDPRTVCFVAICLLEVTKNTRVIQTSRYLLVRPGEKVILRCEQDMKHDYMYWYRQDPGLGLRLIYYSQDIALFTPGDLSKGYNVSRSETRSFLLIVESASPDKTSVYLCASRAGTKSHVLLGYTDSYRKRDNPTLLPTTLSEGQRLHLEHWHHRPG
uniref:Ig-like domain-containing protein n=1 Tax=Ornithorhynchus anatinus TaxID=9258 RepID=A0A6I8P6E7_ORNAN